jgi:hypothetical protein
MIKIFASLKGRTLQCGIGPNSAVVLEASGEVLAVTLLTPKKSHRLLRQSSKV